jgi:hypothetical protein
VCRVAHQQTRTIVSSAPNPTTHAMARSVLSDGPELLYFSPRRGLQVRARATFDERFSAAPFSAALGSIYRELLAEAESRSHSGTLAAKGS